jgi:hypothetical protein
MVNLDYWELKSSVGSDYRGSTVFEAEGRPVRRFPVPVRSYVGNNFGAALTKGAVCSVPT